MTTRDDVITTAREWKGTPYKHQHSTRGAGCDCLGLIRGVYRDLYGTEPETPPNYSPSWGEAGRRELMMEAAGRHLIQIQRIEDARPGDVLIFRMRRGHIAKHCGILVSDTHMIHAYQGAKEVTESAMVPYWRNRVVGVFSYPGVE